MKLKIGIVIPCRNDQKFLKECLESVDNQRVLPHSVVIVDDCSDEPIQRSDLPEKLNPAFPHFLVRNNKQLGLAASRNLGITLCGADWYIPLDSDDQLDSKAIEGCCEIIAKEPRIDIIQFGAVYFNEQESYHNLSVPLPMTTIQQRNPAHPTTLIRTTVWTALGGYVELGDAEHRGYEDWDFWIRASLFPQPINIYQTIKPWLRYRVREGSKLSTQDKEAALNEVWVKYRSSWNNPAFSAEQLKRLRTKWGVQKLQ